VRYASTSILEAFGVLRRSSDGPIMQKVRENRSRIALRLSQFGGRRFQYLFQDSLSSFLHSTRALSDRDWG